MKYSLNDPGSAAEVFEFRMRLDEQGMGGAKTDMSLCKSLLKTSPREAEMMTGVKKVISRANTFDIWFVLRKDQTLFGKIKVV